MSKSSIAAGVFVLVCATTLATTSAFAAFAGKEAKEGSVTLEAKEALSFTIEEGGVKYELTCGVVKGEGAVMEHPGETLSEAKEDKPPSTPTTAISTQLALTMNFEKCNVALGGGKPSEAVVNTEKCRFEIFSENEKEEKSEGLLNLPTAKSESPCTMTIEQAATKCKVEIGDKREREGENVLLGAFKMKNGKEKSESEIESGSEVKNVAATTSNCTGLSAKTEGVFHVNKGIAVKGASLANAQLDLEPREHDFKSLKRGEKSSELVINLTANSEVTFGAASVSPEFLLTKDNCPLTLKVTLKCQIGVKFTPSIAGLLGPQLGILRVPYKVGGINTLTLAFLDGTST